VRRSTLASDSPEELLVGVVDRFERKDGATKDKFTPYRERLTQLVVPIRTANKGLQPSLDALNIVQLQGLKRCLHNPGNVNLVSNLRNFATHAYPLSNLES
jgi:hypothetical protein